LEIHDSRAEWTISVRTFDMIVTIRHEEISMANEIVLQFAVLSVLAVTLLYLTSVLMKRKTRRARPHDVVKVQLAAEMGEKEELKAEPQSPQTITIELKSEPVPLSREQTGNGSDQIDSGASLPETAVIPAVVPSAVSAARR
jgi:2-methylcitrate dehydratase PrpD